MHVNAVIAIVDRSKRSALLSDVDRADEVIAAAGHRLDLGLKWIDVRYLLGGMVEDSFEGAFVDQILGPRLPGTPGSPFRWSEGLALRRGADLGDVCERDLRRRAIELSQMQTKMDEAWEGLDHSEHDDVIREAKAVAALLQSACGEEKAVLSLVEKLDPLQPIQPSRALARVVGGAPRPSLELNKAFLDYLKRKKLLKDRLIQPDDVVAPLLEGFPQATVFVLPQLVMRTSHAVRRGK